MASSLEFVANIIEFSGDMSPILLQLALYFACLAEGPLAQGCPRDLEAWAKLRMPLLAGVLVGD